VVVKYLGQASLTCEVCSKYIAKHSYEWELLFKSLYPKDTKTKRIVCEKCAQREVGSKHWNAVKRGG
tara:strand:+ start:6152 stop:6352 length:201 start_codon:yes stop_codon:yes gene_type:complete